MFLTLERMFQHVHRNIILDHIDQPCAGLGCVEIEFPWKPHRIEFCASINNYPQSADRLYFSHSINCISFLTKTVFLSLHQQYFSHSINHISQLINCISLTVSAIFLSLYQHYFSHLIACITWTSPAIYWLHISYIVVQIRILGRDQQLSTECWSGSWGVRLNCLTTSTVDTSTSLLWLHLSRSETGGCDLTVTTSTRELIKFSFNCSSFFSSSSSSSSSLYE